VGLLRIGQRVIARTALSGDENFDAVVARLCHDVRQPDVDGTCVTDFCAEYATAN
jgi:hypothetical protein